MVFERNRTVSYFCCGSFADKKLVSVTGLYRISESTHNKNLQYEQIPYFSMKYGDFFQKALRQKCHQIDLIGSKTMKNTVSTFLTAKQNGEKLTMLTAYDYSTAKLISSAGINAILVGDSLGNVILGYDDTISVTMEDMIHHSKAVSKGSGDSLVVTDMPFMSYQTSVYDAVVNAGRLMKEGRAGAVKLEGGKSVCPQIKAIVDSGIPVMAHLGLTPQSVNAFGGYKVQGKTAQAAKQLIEDALAVQQAGAFSVVLECVPSELATLVTELLTIPTIGIGAGNGCDGQVLVNQDMLGMFHDYVPKFVKQFANVGEVMTNAFKAYDAEVKSGAYPEEKHSYQIDKEIITHLRNAYMGKD